MRKQRGGITAGVSAKASPIDTLKQLSLNDYDALPAGGVLGSEHRYELIEGFLVERKTKKPSHSTASELCRLAIERILPVGWHGRVEKPMRIANRSSEPDPVYIPAFGLERLHPFDGRKYRRIRDALIARGVRRLVNVVRPRQFPVETCWKFTPPNT